MANASQETFRVSYRRGRRTHGSKISSPIGGNLKVPSLIEKQNHTSKEKAPFEKSRGRVNLIRRRCWHSIAHGEKKRGRENICHDQVRKTSREPVTASKKGGKTCAVAQASKTKSKEASVEGESKSFAATNLLPKTGDFFASAKIIRGGGGGVIMRRNVNQKLTKGRCLLNVRNSGEQFLLGYPREKNIASSTSGSI